MKRALFISCFDWYKMRIEPIREILIKNGYEVNVLIADFDHIKKEKLEKKYKECTYIPVPSYNKNFSLKRIYSHIKFGSVVGRQIILLQPDFVYVLVPPNNIARYCSKYRLKNTKTILCLDIIDLWPESIPFKYIANIPFIKIWKKWRNDCLTISDYTFTECNLYQKELSEYISADKVCTLYLFREQTQTEIAIVNKIVSGFKNERNRIKFAYLGSMNNIIDIEGICSILEGLQHQGCHTEIYAIGDGESAAEFKRRVEAIGCETYFYGTIYDECRIAEILTPCDYGLNMMKNSVKVGLTTKSVHYFSLGLPIINNLKGDTWDIVEKMKIGINVDSCQLDYLTLANSIRREDVLRCFKLMFSYNAFQKRIGKIVDMLEL